MRLPTLFLLLVITSVFAESAADLTQRGLAAGSDEKWNEAILLFTKSLELKPGPKDEAIAYTDRAEAYLHVGKPEDAIRDFDLAIARDPTLFQAFYGRGYAYGSKGDFERAVADYKALQLNPEYAPAYLNRGGILFTRGQLDTAFSDFSNLIRYDPKSIEGYGNRAVIFAMKGNSDKALADFAAAIRINPDYIKAYENRARLYMMNRDWEKAIKDYDEILRLEPDNTTIRQNRAEARSKK
jgi:tetratricopeptide (TPR) repeat protein